MGSQQDVDVKDSEGRRLEGLEGEEADLEEPKPQHTCGVEPPPKNTSGGAVPIPDPPPEPQYQCSVRRPPTNVSGGEKKKPNQP